MDRVNGGFWIGQNLSIQDALEYAGLDMYNGGLPRIPALFDEHKSSFY